MDVWQDNIKLLKALQSGDINGLNGAQIDAAATLVLEPPKTIMFQAKTLLGVENCLGSTLVSKELSDGPTDMPVDAEAMPVDAEAMPVDAEAMPVDAEAMPVDAEVMSVVIYAYRSFASNLTIDRAKINRRKLI